MPFIKKDTYSLEYVADGETLKGLNKNRAFAIATSTVGNSSFNKIFPNEEKYLFGPGDGTTSVIVRQEKDWVPELPRSYDI